VDAPGRCVVAESRSSACSGIATIMFAIAALAHIHIRIDGLRWPSGSVVVACLALGFTIGSFWWLNARQGRLKSFEPYTFAVAFTLAGECRLRFPLVFYNTGATSIVVQNMRLSFPKEPNSMPMYWTTTRTRIMPTAEDAPDFPAVFSVPVRSAPQMFIEFGVVFPGVFPKARDYQVRIEVKLGHRRKWRHLLTFPLQAAHITSPDRYITYSNSPHDLSSEVVAEAEAAMEAFARKVQSFDEAMGNAKNQLRAAGESDKATT
jgi:hypothetical protein